MEFNKVMQGDCIEIMRTLPDGIIDLTVTSPPYDSIREYGNNWQLDLHQVGQELFRITKDGGVAVIIIQDQTKHKAKSVTSFRTIVDWCDNIGWKLFETCIYQRSGTPGAWWSKRFRVDHEYMPIFFKGDGPQYFEKQHLMIDAIQAGKIKSTGGSRKTDGTTNKNQVKAIAAKKCRGTIWNYTNQSKSRDKIKQLHPASFPDQLANDIIQTFTKENMTVFDPMMGSGTVAIESERLSRQWAGCEVNNDYIANIIEPRLAELRQQIGFFKT